MNASALPSSLAQPSSTGPLTLNVLGVDVTFKLRAADTAGAYSLFEASVPPGAGTPPHRQPLEEEAFFGLEGEVSFQVGEERVQLTPGAATIVPRGVPHAFVNASGRPARMLILVSPGGMHERFFEELGTPAHPGQAPAAPAEVDVGRVTEVAARHHMEILPPTF
ncbi:cupin domain-containing protein [Deinococcus hopiensis]|uniref:Cupin domain protein n=1 Tax=Deinococcus hopiensis KR-140 TaxID=695939 RepID=A0A1W1VU43_9DEIO|nr:cupin domain-containing protein [Deinococcus hopiensis]SMB96869.1 Cupin domain protein [Deinococcus hopiensis KR-140]